MSDLNETSRGMRIAIAFLGRRNAGKSSLLNALVGYDLAIVSEQAGTTTDPVDKAVEINPLGPCLVIDTAGIDDSGELGQKRIEKTNLVIKYADVGLIIIGDGKWTPFEEESLTTLQAKKKPVIVVLNKTDCFDYAELENELQDRKLDYVVTIATAHEGISELKQKIRELKNVGGLEEPSIIGDLIKAGDQVLLVVPIDLGAPKGRLILPQVQTIRDILDNDGTAIIVKERELADTLDKMARLPDLVITDSQVVLKVAGDVPAEVPLTTFSTIFSRFKGDLRQMVNGVRAIDKLQNGDKVLIAEACTHHAMADDIGRVKIPRWMGIYTGRKLQFEIAAGPAFPDDVEKYSLIVQCGGCTISRTAYLNRLETAAKRGIPITNYGIAISYVQGVLPRVISPFPEVRDLV
ncbi:MAG TPA: [FeFe] hydrogenase H-cluster maturation GTPase HydF [Syntrophomonadaceae bacterium]|nr:[FeFe] hydrogenase H-cluster maturation GTPase HydF [Syntrophomonadaceae bacterium]HPR94295.1 [FeFe] hydrogenase H-cluster maturation GTPase HydF [Syntrophomonadaceae bacterium]